MPNFTYRVIDTPQEMTVFVQRVAESSRYTGITIEMLEGTTVVAAIYHPDQGDPQLAGGIWGIYQGKHAYLDYLIVRPEAQGFNVGRNLVSAISQYMSAQGVVYLHGLLFNQNGEVVPLGDMFSGPVELEDFLHVERRGALE